MDSRKERVPFVHHFGREIKKVGVVAFLDENQVGAKAVSREKLFLGLAPAEKLPAPFQVVLFQKNLRKGADLCSV